MDYMPHMSYMSKRDDKKQILKQKNRDKGTHGPVGHRRAIFFLRFCADRLLCARAIAQSSFGGSGVRAHRARCPGVAMDCAPSGVAGPEKGARTGAAQGGWEKGLRRGSLLLLLLFGGRSSSLTPGGGGVPGKGAPRERALIKWQSADRSALRNRAVLSP